MDTSRNGYDYSASEDKFLRDNWKLLSDEQLGIELKRGVQGIKKRRSFLKLVRDRKYNLGGERLEIVLRRMQELIHLCETSSCKPKIDAAKVELKQLSGLEPRNYYKYKGKFIINKWI